MRAWLLSILYVAMAGSFLVFTPRVRGDDGTPALLDIPTLNPADENQPTSRPDSQTPEHVSAYELPAVTVVGQPPAALHEDELIGSYDQPRWTADRRFPGVRTYVMPEGNVEFEYWERADVPRHGATENQQFYELEFGLPSRFQLDFYLVARSMGGGSTQTYFDQQVELRYALADWGKIWGNPTLYAEYEKHDQAPDEFEGKLLLSGDIGSGWHWGQNILFEGELSGDKEYEYGWTGGLSYTVIDQELDIGAEAQCSLFDTSDTRGTYHDETFLGPSLQFRPRKNMHLDLAPLFGVTGESPLAKLFFVFGWEF